jgi:hypothetical protein
MKQTKKRQVEWFLELANMSFEGEYFEKILYLIQDMKIFFGKTLHPGLSGLRSVDLPPEMAEAEMSKEIETFKQLQLKANQFLNDIVTKYKEAENYKIGGKPLTVFGLSDIAGLRTLGQMEIKINAKLMIRNNPQLKPIRGVSKRKRKQTTRQWIAFWGDNGTLENSPIELVITPKGDDECFLFSFAQTLDGILLKSIKKCSDCNNWFFQASKRERFFCSNKCRARKFNKDRRKMIKEKGGEKYKTELEKGKRRARASYENRRKKQLGPNVKIKRKKTEKKKEK